MNSITEKATCCHCCSHVQVQSRMGDLLGPEIPLISRVAISGEAKDGNDIGVGPPSIRGASAMNEKVTSPLAQFEVIGVQKKTLSPNWPG
jgi:hypothetical protein